jgi:hypothetical protein
VLTEIIELVINARSIGNDGIDQFVIGPFVVKGAL